MRVFIAKFWYVPMIDEIETGAKSATPPPCVSSCFSRFFVPGLFRLPSCMCTWDVQSRGIGAIRDHVPVTSGLWGLLSRCKMYLRRQGARIDGCDADIRCKQIAPDHQHKSHLFEVFAISKFSIRNPGGRAERILHSAMVTGLFSESVPVRDIASSDPMAQSPSGSSEKGIVFQEERRIWGHCFDHRGTSSYEATSPRKASGSQEHYDLEWGEPPRRKRGSEDNVGFTRSKRCSLTGTEPAPLCDVAAQTASSNDRRGTKRVLPSPSSPGSSPATSSFDVAVLSAMFDNCALVASDEEQSVIHRRRRRRGGATDLLDLTALSDTHQQHAGVTMTDFAGVTAEAPCS